MGSSFSDKVTGCGIRIKTIHGIPEDSHQVSTGTTEFIYLNIDMLACEQIAY
jgi:hypothetical protein